MDQGRVAKRRRRRWMSQNNRLLIPNADVWPQASDWLIRDEFTDTVAAGSVNGTAATPGPGTRVVVDTDSDGISVGSGVLAFANPNTAWDQSVYYAAVSRAAGMAIITRFNSPALQYALACGFSSSQSDFPASHCWRLTGTQIRYDDAVVSSFEVGTWATSTQYDIAIVLRSSGAILAAKISGAWTLLWVASTDTTASVYPGVANYNGTGWSLDYLRTLALPAPFDTNDGLATDVHSGSVAAGTTFTHEADCLIEATITTVPSADNIDIVFRQQDASNYWICRIATGGDISLQEVVAGSPTQRGVAAGVVSNGHRVVVIADGSTIKGYSNNTLRWTYSSASNFATATAGEVDALGTGGAVSNVKTWPRTLSGTAASILNKVSA